MVAPRSRSVSRPSARQVRYGSTQTLPTRQTTIGATYARSKIISMMAAAFLVTKRGFFFCTSPFDRLMMDTNLATRQGSVTAWACMMTFQISVGGGEGDALACRT
jgi:hypothetical protein